MRIVFARILILVLLCAGIVPAAKAAPAENLLLITYDGLRWQEVFGGLDQTIMSANSDKAGEMLAIGAKYWADTPEERRAKLLPFLWNSIARQGILFGHAESGSLSRVTNTMNFSYPGYNEILTGAPDPAIDSNDKRNNPNENVLEWINKRPGFTGRVAAFTSWDVFPYILNVERNGLPLSAGWEGKITSRDAERAALLNEIQTETPHYWDGVRFDVFTHNAAVEYIKEHQPRVIYVAYGETDDWAHDGRYNQYADSAWRTDDYIRRLWELLQSMPQYKDKTALLMTTDHGRGDTPEDWTSHGRKLPQSDRIWIAAMGAGVAAKGVASDTPSTQSQVAATAAALLGLDYNAAHPKAAMPLPLK